MTKTELGFYARLAILLAVVIVHIAADSGASFSDGLQEISPSYWIAIVYGAYLGLYVVTLRCKACHSPIIYKAINPAQWRLPKSTCSNCGSGT